MTTPTYQFPTVTAGVEDILEAFWECEAPVAHIYHGEMSPENMERLGLLFRYYNVVSRRDDLGLEVFRPAWCEGELAEWAELIRDAWHLDDGTLPDRLVPTAAWLKKIISHLDSSPTSRYSLLNTRTPRSWGWRSPVDKKQSHKRFRGDTFDAKDLQGVDFSNSLFIGASFRGANLTRASFLEACAVGVEFTRADLLEADLRGAVLALSDFGNASLASADLRHAELRASHLVGANLRRADLQHVDLRWSDLRWANFANTNLRWADLTNARLVGSKFDGAKLHGAKINEYNRDIVEQHTMVDHVIWVK